MAKKIEKEECSCGCNCGKGCCVWGTILSILCLVAAAAACFYACKASQAAQKVYDFNVLSAGGIETFERMNKVYESEAYIAYAQDNADQAESYFGLSEGADVEGDESDEASINAGGDDIKTVVENMLASTPIRGDANARFTIVEYTELLCPFCQRHSSEGTINAVIEKFPGEVNSISKHFIIHGDEAQKLASAMECVNELNSSAYNEVFEKAFEAYPVDMDTLISIATAAGTDETALKSCVDEGRYMQAVTDMMNQGNELFGVNGTPGNVIIDRETGNYKLVSGAYPVDEFVNAINELKNA